MSAPGSWQVLDISVEDAPQLLLRAQLGDSGYEVELMDLSHVWRETATKQDIIQRATDAGSSIDPGQDREQFKIFLSKIEDAINGKDGTTFSLHANDNDGTTLSAEISAKLPHPLPAFAWTLQLQRLEPQYTAALLVTPLLHQASRLHQQIEQLIHELHDKDRVISKICDRLETSGNDLTTVFPGVSNVKTSRKKGQREQLAKHVKGLADFDESAWKAQHAFVESSEIMDADQMNIVLRDLPIPDSGANVPSASESWWQHLDKGSESRINGRHSAGRQPNSPQNRTTRNESQREESMRDDEFQTQGTPPHLKHTSPRERPASQREEPTRSVASSRHHETDIGIREGDESTTEDDDDDLDAAPRKPVASQPSQSSLPQNKVPSPSPRKLGMIGGRSEETQMPARKEASPDEIRPAAKPRTKLGKIGGKGKVQDFATPEPPVENRSSGPQAKAAKVGVIGGKRAATHSSEDERDKAVAEDQTAVEEERQSRAETKVPSPVPRETSQERADRVRDELKRQLEEKERAAPKKKKRKF